MQIGVYQGASALTSLERWQQVVAQNIASASVPGYKQQTIQARGIAMAASPDRTNTDFPSYLKHSMLAAESGIDFSAGPSRETGDAYDFAIEGDAFFQAERPDGSTLYTRDGEFHVNDDGVLVTKLGYPVRGQGGYIQLTPNGGPLQSDPEGRLSQNGGQIGRFALARIENLATLERSAGGFVARDGVGNPAEAVGDEARVRQGYLEGSNVSAVTEMVRLIELSRAYEANQKAITTQDEQMSRANQSLGPTA